MIFDALHESAQRGELLLVDGGMCHWHLRRDGQVTIREIISTRKGAGRQMLNRLKATLGATSLFAKCPVNLPAINWYTRNGFHVERMEIKGERKLWHLRMWLDPYPRQINGNGVEVIYSSGGNPRFVELALDAGMLTGSQMPEKVYFRPYFVDQNWKNPQRDIYMERLNKLRPYMATAIDWEREDQYTEVMSWAEQAAEYVQELIIIPKLPGTITRIPHEISGKRIRLGYSVPTRYGKTLVHPSEFKDRPVHLLGGSPKTQLALHNEMNVVSVDGNYHQKIAVQGTQVVDEDLRYVTLRDIAGNVETDPHYHAFYLSSLNIMNMWRNRDKEKRPAMPYTKSMF